MPQNDYLPFGNDPAANVITQTDYQNLPNRGTGLVAGLARSAVFNKIFRQLSMGVSALMEAVGNVRNVNITDDGNFGNLTSLLERAIAGATRWVNANTTLTADDAGLVLINAAGGAVTLTLPAASAANGRPLRLQLVRTDATLNAVTVQRAGADTIEGSTAISLAVRERLEIVSDGTATWVFPSGRHTQGLAANGWQRLPSGLILQWGQATTSASGPQTVTFPVVFPAACLTAIVSASGGAVITTITPGSLQPAFFQVDGYNTAGARVAAGAAWMALGQ
jgi:hypothetical protein